MFKKIFFVILFLCLGVFFGINISSSYAVETEEEESEVVPDSVFYDWVVYYTNGKEEEKKCYIATFAKEQKGNYKEPRQPYIMISIFKEKNTEKVSVYSGYTFKINSAIYLGIDNKQFRLMTEGDRAWAANNDEDRIIIKELLNAKTIKIKGETISGEYTIDTYSTEGITRAYNKMQELCK